MQFKQKLAYMGFGGLLVLTGILLSSIITGKVAISEGNQSVKFDEVTCRSLKVVDGTGKRRIQIEVTEQAEEEGVTDDVIQIFDDESYPIYRLGTAPMAGCAMRLGADKWYC